MVTAPGPDRTPDTVVLPDRYRVEHVIGRGGTAIVYSAHDTLLNRPVAIKAFTAPTDSARILREQQHEAQTLAGLGHYALVTLFDAGVDDSDPRRPHIYLVMERIDGPDLGQQLRSGALTALQVTYLGLDLCDALAYVHERGYLHRDIKPANVLISARSLDRRIRGKLSDFGIATVLGTAADEGEFTVGTAAYLSPEQVEGKVLGAASDVYSLGLVLIQAATGRVAFPGAVLESAFARLTNDPEIPAGVPPRLAAVLAAMTTRHPGERIGLEDARAAFERALADEIASGGSPELPARPAQAPRREQIDAAPPDAEFVRITGTAARVLRCPAAFVVLGAHGSESFACVPEVHRAELSDLAFRCLGVDSPVRWTADDVRTDPRTAGAVSSAPVVSMAAQPLIAGDGSRIGLLAVLDAVPRRYGEDELATLTDLAHLVTHEHDLRQAVRRALFAR